jgi:alpha-1,3-mannosyltransferase
MPWNDLYRISRRLAPGLMYPILQVSPWQFRVIICWENCIDKKFKYFKSGPISALLLIIRIFRRNIKKGGHLILHVHNPVLGFIAVLTKFFCPQIKVIVNMHNDWRYFQYYQKFGIFLLSKIADRFITVSKSLISTIPKRERLLLQKKRKLISIYNGIDSRRLIKFQRKNSSFVTAVVIARMVPQKNCFFILDILSQTHLIDYLIWFGEGSEKDKIERKIEQFGIGNRIELRGIRPRDEVYQTLAQSSIYISASNWEGIGVANLEAAALGCWPFMSDIPPHREIAEVLNISIYPLENINAWIKAIEDFIKLPIDRQNRKRRELVELTIRNFDLDNTVSKYIELYLNEVAPISTRRSLA